MISEVRKRSIWKGEEAYFFFFLLVGFFFGAFFLAAMRTHPLTELD
jgi:hypothetical protein